MKLLHGAENASPNCRVKVSYVRAELVTYFFQEVDGTASVPIANHEDVMMEPFISSRNKLMGPTQFCNMTAGRKSTSQSLAPETSANY